jgi:small conductance mechanosensitive channel
MAKGSAHGAKDNGDQLTSSRSIMCIALDLVLMWQQIIFLPEWLEQVVTQIRARLLAAIPGLLTGLIILLVFFLIARAARNLIQSVVPRVHGDVNIMLLLSRICYYGILTLGLFTALPKMGLDITALITGLGLTGFALGFALKDVLSNLISGIMLLIYRPFQIGDQIVMGTYEGKIETIRMRDTVLRGYDGRMIIIPNSKLITEVVINNRSAQLVREEIEVELASSAGTEAARGLLTQALAQIPSLVGRVEPQVTAHLRGDKLQLLAHFWRDPQRINATEMEKEVAQAVRKLFAGAGLNVTTVALKRATPETKEETEKESAPVPSAED